MAVGLLQATARIDTSVPAALQLFPAPGGGLSVGTWPGTIQVSRSRVDAFNFILIIVHRIIYLYVYILLILLIIVHHIIYLFVIYLLFLL